MTHDVKLGITIYSLTRDFYMGKYSVEDCIGIAAKLGCRGFEIVGAQMVRGYPWPSEAEIQGILEAAARNGTRLICYSSNCDRGIRADRDMTDDEVFAYTLNDIRYAHRFGATVMRAQMLVSPRIMARIAPYAEEYNVKVGIEIHSPETPSSPLMQEYFETCEKAGSKFIGFVPDFGAFADRPNRFFVEGLLKQGAHEKIVAYMTEARYNDVARPVVEAEIGKMGANDADRVILDGFYSFTTFHKPDWEGLKRIMPYSVHFHGKFHGLEENGDDVSIPVDTLLPLIRGSGYDGWIMSEFEGDFPGDVADLLRRHLAMERRILDR